MKVVNVFSWHPGSHRSFGIETGLVANGNQVIYCSRQRFTTGKVFLTRILAKLENVAQDCPSFPTRGKFSSSHRLDNSNYGLTVGVIGIINPGAAICAWLDF